MNKVGDVNSESGETIRDAFDANEFPVSFNQEESLVRSECVTDRQSRVCLPTDLTLALQLTGRIEPDCVQYALNTIVDRHAGLRATFHRLDLGPGGLRARIVSKVEESGVCVPGLYKQRVRSSAPVALREVPAPRSKCARTLPWDHPDEPTRLDVVPSSLLRATLSASDGDKRWLMLRISRLAIDKCSEQVFIDDFASLYDAVSRGDASGANTVVSHAPQFALWQHRHWTKGGYYGALEFWREEWLAIEPYQLSYADLGGATIEPHSTDVNSTEGSAHFMSDIETALRLKALAQRLDVTVHQLFVTLVALVLVEMTHKQRLVVWSSWPNRRILGNTHAIGWYENTHAVHVDATAGSSASDLARQVGAQMQKLESFSALPLPMLWYTLGRRLDRGPRVLVDFASEGFPRRAADAYMQPYAQSIGGRLADVEIRVCETAEGLLVCVLHDCTRIPLPTAHNLAALIKAFLLRLLEKPRLAVADLLR